MWILKISLPAVVIGAVALAIDYRLPEQQPILVNGGCFLVVAGLACTLLAPVVKAMRVSAASGIPGGRFLV